MVYFNQMTRLLSAFIVCSLLLGAALAEVVPGRLLVKFKPRGVSAASTRALTAKYGAVEMKQLYAEALKVLPEGKRPEWLQKLANDWIVTLPPTTDVKATQSAAQLLKNEPNVDSVALDSRVHAFDVTPNDPGFALQWGLTQIKAPKAWVKTTGTSEVIIAVLDTGLNYSHEDFAGKVDTADMKDLVNGDSDPLDDYGHGTAVSGVIGAIANNGKGIAGLDWNCKILPIKVLDSSGSGLVSTISAGLVYLATLKHSGVNIVAANMSLGQYNSGTDHYTEEDPFSLRERCQEATNEGIVLVAAAGNGGVDWNTYPAYYPTVIAVAATDSSDKRSVWSGIDPETGRIQSSNYSRKGVPGYSDNLWVDVAAPGSGIYSTDKNGSYSSGWNGTSLASPYVAGLIGLMKAASPAMTVSEIMAQIRNTADNLDTINPSFSGMLGTGRINAYRALAGIIAEISSPAAGSYLRGVVNVKGTAAGWNFQSFQLDAFRGTSVEAAISAGPASIEGGQVGAWNTVGLDGEFTIRLRVIGKDLSTCDATAAVVVDNTSPEAAISLPVSGTTVEGRVTISGKAKDLYFDRYLLEYGAGIAPSGYQLIGTYYDTVESGTLGTWETTGLSGVYTIRLTAQDRSGNTTASSALVEIVKQVPTKEVEPQTGLPLTYALPNPFNLTATTETAFVYDLAGNFDTTIYLFDLNGNLIWSKSFLAGDNGGKSGRNNPAWNGQNLFSERVPNGVYFYQVIADKKVIGRGKIIVLN
jgi:subtilisin family serine protease